MESPRKAPLPGRARARTCAGYGGPKSPAALGGKASTARPGGASVRATIRAHMAGRSDLGAGDVPAWKPGEAGGRLAAFRIRVGP